MLVSAVHGQPAPSTTVRATAPRFSSMAFITVIKACVSAEVVVLEGHSCC